MANTITLSPSCKLCRREGEKLFLKGDRCHTPKCAIVRRSYIPGAHGIKRQPKLSEYGQQLRSKQKAKRLYGIMERQFHNYYTKALTNTTDTDLYLKQLLELRLDNVVYRLGLTKSRSQAKQVISHGHIYVNGKKLDIPSYGVNIGDIISIRERSKKSHLFKGLTERLAQTQYPSWITFDINELSGKVVSRPTSDDLKDTIEARQIIEFYSRF